VKASHSSSPFLDRPRLEWVALNALAFAIKDLHPVSPGHTLVVPLRLVPTWFEASPEEKAAIAELVDIVWTELPGMTLGVG